MKVVVLPQTGCMRMTRKSSIKERFTSIIEDRILSGELAIGQRLPSEREISSNLGISRTIVHAGLIELAAKKVLRIVPRKGTYVNDYRREGTFEIYTLLMQYTGTIHDDLFRSLMEYRGIFETGNARLAALNRSDNDIFSLREMLQKERMASTLDEAVDLDYEIHLSIALSTKNMILPMTISSTQAMYKALVKLFYSKLEDREQVYTLHEKLIKAIEYGNPENAERAMKEILTHGENILDEYCKKPQA